MATRRGRDLRIEYDSDDGSTKTVAQRTYEDADGVRITPITPLLEARLVSGVPIDRSRLQPRHAMACIPNPVNSSGVSEMMAISPYRPGDERLLQHLRQIRSHSNGLYAVATITYFGEGLR
jgi:hypothetical protein